MLTVNRAYSNLKSSSFGNLRDGLIRCNLRASIVWKDFWDLDTLLESTNEPKRSSLDPDGALLLKMIAQGVSWPRNKWSSAAPLEGSRQLYHDEALQ
jgi:hypothetical protein